MTSTNNSSSYSFSTRITDREVETFKEQTFRIRHPNGERNEPWPSDCEPSEKMLGGNLAIERTYEWTLDNNWCRVYEIEVLQFLAIQYKIDFEGTTNHDIQAVYGVEDMTVALCLQPFERETICMISRDITQEHELHIKGEWKKSEIHPNILQNAIIIGANKVKDVYDQCLDSGINETLEWTEMPDIVRNNNLRFVDGEFYPAFESLYADGKESHHCTENYVVWRRASDFCSLEWPMIFKDPSNLKKSILPSFVKQGELDNAWLTSVISVMALRPDLLSRIFISKDGNGNPSQTKVDTYYGFFLLQLCFNGKWTTTIIDDLFPCLPYGLPIYTSCPVNDQLWPALIEKCYAKFLGACFENLDTGKISSAFADLTGAPTEDFYINECDKNELWSMLVEMCKTYDTLACCICDAERDRNSENSGLIAEHAYSIIRVEKDMQLICLRDPFGKISEWNGDWSANNERWDDDQNRKKCYSNIFEHKEEFDPQSGDGIFWMSFEDFCQYFTLITFCYCKQGYSEARQVIDIQFDHETNQLTVPVLQFTVPAKSYVEWIGLSQHDIINGQQSTKSQLDVCLFVMKATSHSVSVVSDEPFGYIPMQTKRQQFVQFGGCVNGMVEQKSNSSSFKTNANCFKNNDVLNEGTYWLIPWTSAHGLLNDANENGVNDGIESRYFNLTVHGKCSTKKGFDIQIVDGYVGHQIDSVLERFCFMYGDKKVMGDLERCRLQMGQMEIYCGRNCSSQRVLNFSMTANYLDNTISVNGYHFYETGKTKKWKIEPNMSQIFAVQIPNDPTVEFSAAYKYGLQ